MTTSIPDTRGHDTLATDQLSKHFGVARTADIETIRTVGIHGPIELHVVILDVE